MTDSNEMNQPLYDDPSHEGEYSSSLNEPTQDEKTLALLAHVLTFVVWFVPPLVIYLAKKDESDFVRRHAAESLNFQISVMIYAVISAVLCLLLVGFLMLIALGICTMVFVLIATIRASEGKEYRYPMTIRFVD